MQHAPGTAIDDGARARSTAVVSVTRPIAVRQLAAGLATVAAASLAVGLSLSLTTVERGPGGFAGPWSITRFASGEQIRGIEYEGLDVLTVTWAGPVVLAALLLTGAALAALAAARTDDRDGWARAAQLLAVAGGAATAGVLAVLVVFGVVDVHTGNYDTDDASVSTSWGPLPAVLALVAVLAAATAATVRRGRAEVLATVEVRS